jgi:S1-C subfamily serine protease
MWSNLAAARYAQGEKRDLAIQSRDFAAEKMTADQLALAQDMARNWRPKPESPGKRPRTISIEEAYGRAIPDDHRGASRSDVIDVQAALAALGYDPGPADGILGSKTRAAIRAYQAALGLRVDGEVSDALLASLQTARALAGAAPQPKVKEPELFATGTGFVVDRVGHVLTNQHVVADCKIVRAGNRGAGTEPVAGAPVDNQKDKSLRRGCSHQART